jgi:hypothetical protein
MLCRACEQEDSGPASGLRSAAEWARSPRAASASAQPAARGASTPLAAPRTPVGPPPQAGTDAGAGAGAGAGASGGTGLDPGAALPLRAGVRVCYFGDHVVQVRGRSLGPLGHA